MKSRDWLRLMGDDLPRVMWGVGLSLFLCSSAPADTFVAVLKSGNAPDDHARIINPDGTFGIPSAGFGTYVDKAFLSVERISEAELNQRFGPALEAMNAVLASGLAPLSHSYVALLEHPAGPLGSLDAWVHNKSVYVREPGQAAFIDGYSDMPFTLEASQLEADFGPVLAAMTEIRQSGVVPNSYVMLLENPDGGVGKVSLTDSRGTFTLTQAGQAVDLDVQRSPFQAFQADDKTVREDFAMAMEARPPLPVNFTLFFESGSARLTSESLETLERLMDDLKKRPVPEVQIKGHADTRGRDAPNQTLSRARSEFIAAKLRALDVPAGQVEVMAFGERNLPVPTPDNTAELRNRRVDVSVR